MSKIHWGEDTLYNLYTINSKFSVILTKLSSVRLSREAATISENWGKTREKKLEKDCIKDGIKTIIINTYFTLPGPKGREFKEISL